MSAPHFQDRKMKWLLRVAGHPATKHLALETAVAMANRANSKTCVVSAKLLTLASDLARSDDTGLSRGAAQLVELGFLKARKAGRKVIWTVDLNAAPAHPEQSPKAKGHVKNLRAKVAQARNDESCAPAQQSEGMDPNTNKAEQLRTCAAQSCAPAQFDEIHSSIPEGKTAHAVFSQSVIVETEDKTKAQETDHNPDLDRSPDGAVHHDPQSDEVDHEPVITVSTTMVETRGRTPRPRYARYPELLDYVDVFTDYEVEGSLDRLDSLIGEIGVDEVAERMRLYQVDSRSITSLADWLDQQDELYVDPSDLPEEDDTDAA